LKANITGLPDTIFIHGERSRAIFYFMILSSFDGVYTERM
jgi:hypothetical protein